eukprot:TRINITY_DN7062_c0_g1_i1.p1 TRINITY_DN7062_c0_g1~~TRINITY_DN7062_c0_g1_i1.p1  ORF type:complete len:812 (-),score=187.34 TRINITY_DN7062_c0_g1_i1:1534-3969(-)
MQHLRSPGTDTVATVTTTRNGEIRALNRRCLIMLGYAENELVGQSIDLIMSTAYSQYYEYYLQRTQEDVSSKIEHPTSHCIELRRKNRAIILARMTITERIDSTAEDKLILVQFQELQSGAARFWVNSTGVVSKCQHVDRLLGYADGEVENQCLSKLTPEPFTSVAEAFLQQYIQLGTRCVAAVHKRGTIVPVMQQVTKQQTPDVSDVKDVQYVVEWEDASDVDAVCQVAVDGSIVSTSATFSLMFGYDDTELLGRNIHEIFPQWGSVPSLPDTAGHPAEADPVSARCKDHSFIQTIVSVHQHIERSMAPRRTNVAVTASPGADAAALSNLRVPAQDPTQGQDAAVTDNETVVSVPVPTVTVSGSRSPRRRVVPPKAPTGSKPHSADKDTHLTAKHNVMSASPMLVATPLSTVSGTAGSVARTRSPLPPRPLLRARQSVKDFGFSASSGSRFHAQQAMQKSPQPSAFRPSPSMRLHRIFGSTPSLSSPQLSAIGSDHAQTSGATAAYVVLVERHDVDKDEQARVHDQFFDVKELLIGSYCIKNMLAEGGFAWVARAVHLERTEESAAVKIFQRSNFDDQLWNLVHEEIRTMKLITDWAKRENQQHVVQLYEIVQTSARVYMVMELADMTVELDILYNDHLHPFVAHSIFVQVMQTLQWLHAHHIAHLDIKPQNIMYSANTSHQLTPLVKLIDFGSAQHFVPGQKRATCCGTVQYAAPEMMAGREFVGPECDVWSAGVLLYVMLTGNAWCNITAEVTEGYYEAPEEASEECADMLKRMFVLDQDKRMTVDEILQHPYVLNPPERPQDDSHGT